MPAARDLGRSGRIGDERRAAESADLGWGAPGRHPAPTLVAVGIPTFLLLTARTFVDKYGPDERYDILKHLPNVSVPLLVTTGAPWGVVERWLTRE